MGTIHDQKSPRDLRRKHWGGPALILIERFRGTTYDESHRVTLIVGDESHVVIVYRT